MQHVARHARLMQQPHASRGDQRRLLGRFREHRIARGERARDLASENRQRKIPRRDAGKDAAAMQRQLVFLAGWSRKLDRLFEQRARARPA